MLTRLMMKFGTPAPQAHGRGRRRRRAPPRPERARLEKDADGSLPARRRRQLRPRLAPRRPGARPRRLHRGRPRPLARACTSSATPIPTDGAKKEQGLPRPSCSSGRTDDREARAVPDHRRARPTPRSVVTRAGSERRARQERDRREDPRAAQGPAQVAARRAVRFASLGSGSEGNGLVVEAGGTRVLIDCGFGVRDTAARLARLGLAPDSLDRDPRHPRALRPRRRRAGVRRAARHSGLATFGTLAAVSASASTAWRTSTASTATTRFAIGDARDRAVPGAARRARAGAVRGRRRRAAARRADRPRRVDAARRGEPVRLRRAGARMQPRPRPARRAATIRIR